MRLYVMPDQSIRLSDQAVRTVIESLTKDGVTLNKDLLFPVLKESSSTSHSAWCEHHDRNCFLERATVHICGFPCVSWSPQGSRKADNGNDFKMWCAWAAHRRKKQDYSIINFDLTIDWVPIIFQSKNLYDKSFNSYESSSEFS